MLAEGLRTGNFFCNVLCENCPSQLRFEVHGSIHNGAELIRFA